VRNTVRVRKRRGVPPQSTIRVRGEYRTNTEKEKPPRKERRSVKEGVWKCTWDGNGIGYGAVLVWKLILVFRR